MNSVTETQENVKRFLPIALREARQGRLVFPCKGKKPAIAGGNGCVDGTTDENQIYRWADQFPYANVGINFTNESEEAGLDADKDTWEKFEALQKAHPESFLTRTVLTGKGGYHYYYKRPKGVMLRNIAKDEGLGFELKSHNAYLIAPGSLHPDTGKYYELVADMQPIPLPEWLIKIASVSGKTGKVVRQPAKTIAKLNSAWHSELISHIGRMRSLGHTEAEIETLALALNHDSGNDPLPDNEVIKMVKEYESQRRVDDGGIPLDDTLHDAANAERLIAYCDGHYKYNYDRNLFYFYDGKKWIEDKGGLILAAAKTTARNIYREAAETEDKNKQDSITRHAKASQSNSRIKAMIELAKDVLSVEIQDLNANPYLLNVNNGTINLKTGKLQPHNPDDLITQFIPIDYIPEAKGARFETFLNEVFEGNQDLIGYIQRALGYSITGDQSETALFFNKGAGFNGKSTLYGIVGDILADYADEIDPLAFMLDKNAHVGPNESLANLYGKRFVTSVEVKSAMRLNVALVKRMTGGEMIRCERKFEHGFNFKPTHKLWILGNAEPRIDDNTNSIWYRIKYINFAVTFPEGKRDKKLRETIVKNEAPAVLAWMVAGCLDWLKDGLREPQSIKEAVSAYRDSQDILHDYTFENLFEGSAETSKVKDVYANYKAWAGENNFEPLGKIAFGNVLKEKGFTTKPGSKNEQYWHGFRLKTPQDSVKSVSFDTQNLESPKKNPREIDTSEKIGNKSNRNNTSNTSNELSNCPEKGQTNDIDI